MPGAVRSSVLRARLHALRYYLTLPLQGLSEAPGLLNVFFLPAVSTTQGFCKPVGSVPLAAASSLTSSEGHAIYRVGRRTPGPGRSRNAAEGVQSSLISLRKTEAVRRCGLQVNQQETGVRTAPCWGQERRPSFCFGSCAGPACPQAAPAPASQLPQAHGRALIPLIVLQAIPRGHCSVHELILESSFSMGKCPGFGIAWRYPSGRV